ncbi:MAG TPA: cysteine dioxygenase family protein [Gaiellaceae bacterium]
MNKFAIWIRDRVPAGEDLTRDQLAELARAIGEKPALWRAYVKHDPHKRHWHQLYRDPHLDVWLICWDMAQDTGYHDHDQSSGAVYVVEGTLLEDYFFRTEDGWVRELTRERPAGAAWHFDSASIHGMRHSFGPPVTSIHVYSPALWRMGHYEPGPLGLRRESTTYADEVWSG